MSVSLRWGSHRAQFGLDRHVISSQVLPGDISMETVTDPVLPDVEHVHVYRARSAYLLRNVVFDPHSGDVLSSGRVIRESRPDGILGRNRPLRPRALEQWQGGIATGLRPASYYHWMLEELPSLLLATNLEPLVVGLIDRSAPRYIRESAAALGLHLTVVSAPQVVDRFLLIDRGDDSGWPRTDNVDIICAALHDLAHPRSPLDERIFVSRCGSAREGSLGKQLEVVAASKGYRVLRLHETPWLEQIQAFVGATRIVGAHGAGFANLVASSKGATVHEVMGPSFANPVYELLCRRLGLDYSRSLGDLDTMETWAPAFEVDG
jgi:hypothetical protein